MHSTELESYTMKIMIVDDHAAMRRTLRSVIESSSHRSDEYIECDDSNSAIEQFKQSQPDVVLMDIQLPTKNGFYAAEEILKYQPKANIIFVTSHDTQIFRNRAQQLQARGFISKENLSELNLLLQTIIH